MSISRRRFLITTGLSAAGAISASSSLASSSLASKRPAATQDWSAVRSQFDLARDYVHLSSFFLASHPRIVREAIERHRAAIDNNPFLYVERQMFEMPGKVRASAAEYLGGKPEEVALTDSTTGGLTMVYHGLVLKPGQEILTTAHDHYVHHEAIRLAAERAGAVVKKISLYDRLDSIT